MGKKVKSARGEIIDLDLFRIKEQIASMPAPVDVKQRQDFIERRLRRRLKKKPVETTPSVEVEPQLPVTDKVENDKLEQEAIIPPEQEETITTDESTDDKPAKRTTKQRARPKRKTKSTESSE